MKLLLPYLIMYQKRTPYFVYCALHIQNYCPNTNLTSFCKWYQKMAAIFPNSYEVMIITPSPFTQEHRNVKQLFLPLSTVRIPFFVLKLTQYSSISYIHNWNCQEQYSPRCSHKFCAKWLDSLTNHHLGAKCTFSWETHRGIAAAPQN